MWMCSLKHLKSIFQVKLNFSSCLSIDENYSNILMKNILFIVSFAFFVVDIVIFSNPRPRSEICNFALYLNIVKLCVCFFSKSHRNVSTWEFNRLIVNNMKTSFGVFSKFCFSLSFSDSSRINFHEVEVDLRFNNRHYEITNESVPFFLSLSLSLALALSSSFSPSVNTCIEKW